MLNLISNASKFQENGEIIIHAQINSSDEQEDNGLILYVTVGDSGIGMTKDEIRNAFEPFKKPQN